MEPSRSANLSLAEYVRIVSRHKGKALLVAGSTVLLTAAVVLFQPSQYVSECKLFVHVGRETVALDPTAATGQTVQVHASRKDEINSVVALLKSQDMLAGVVDALGPEKVLAREEPAGVIATVSGAIQSVKDRLFPSPTKPSASASESCISGPREDAIEFLASRVEISSERDTTVINVRCQAPSPELAQLITSTLVKVYREAHMRLHRTFGSEQFFAEQKSLFQEKVNRSQLKLFEIRDAGGYASIKGQCAQLEAEKASIAHQQLDIDRQIAASEAKCAALTEAVSQLDETILQSKVVGMPNAAADGMRQRLYELQIRERELLEQYQSNHPSVRAIQAQVSSLTKIHENESQARDEATMAINPTRQELQLQLLQEKAELEGYRVKREALQQQQEPVMLALKQLNRQATEVEKLQRESDILDETYRSYAKSYELARIDSALQAEKITNVNVAQEATLPRTPSSPRKSVLAVLGLLAAVFGGLAVPLFAEFFRQSLDSPAELEAALEVPVLMVIPRSREQCVGA